MRARVSPAGSRNVIRCAQVGRLQKFQQNKILINSDNLAIYNMKNVGYCMNNSKINIVCEIGVYLQFFVSGNNLQLI